MQNDSADVPPPVKPALDSRGGGEVAPGAAPFGGWAVRAAQGAAWWSEGWRLFVASPGLWIVLVIICVVLLVVLAVIPIIGQLASTLLYPVLNAGLLVGARDVERGQPLAMRHLVSCFDQRVGPLMLAGLLYIAGWFLIWLLAIAVCIGIFGIDSLAALADASPFDFDLLMTLGAAAMIAFSIVLILGTPWMMAYWFAPALIAMRGDGPLAAMKASLLAALRNIPPFLIYSLMGIAFAIIASLPLGLGWIVLAPVFVASVYASYRDIFQGSGGR